MSAILSNCRVLSTSNYFISNSYNNHLRSIANGSYAAGVDIVSCNSTGTYIKSKVLAHSDGVVLYAGDGDGYGNAVWVKHSDGYVTGYGHLESLAVKTGQSVSKGTVLGIIGTSGHSTGVHLHFEVRKYKSLTYINPPSRANFWDANSFMSKTKFDFIDPTSYVYNSLPCEPKKNTTKWYYVQVGSFTNPSNAKRRQEELIKAGYSDCIIKKSLVNYRVQIGAFENKNYAENAAEIVRRLTGFDAKITTEGGVQVVL